MMKVIPILLAVALVTFALLPGQVHGMSEEDRMREYHLRNYTWPLPEVKPNTEGWRKIFDRRWKQIERIEDSNERYNGWVQAMSASIVQPNFTENGWGLTQAPKALVKELKDALHAGLPTATTENKVDVIEGDIAARPLFVRTGLNKKVLDTLKPMHEDWAGVELEGEIAYGLRVYRNNSRLLMHVDKSKTHVISCILHIDSSEDSEPWPIVIEDFHGNTNEVVLKSGDMLFYESSKCFHGRPKTFKGSWYSSIFVHYYPVDWDTVSRDMESHYAVPPVWSKQYAPPGDDGLEKLVMVGTSMKEPDCDHVWCALNDPVTWTGPAKEGEVISATGKSYLGNFGDEL